MQTEPLYPLPARAKAIVAAASNNGWNVFATYSGVTDPPNVVVRFSKEGRAPAYGSWIGNKWNGAATRQADPFSYKVLNQGQLLAYIEGTSNPHASAHPDGGSEPDRVEGPDAGGEAVG